MKEINGRLRGAASGVAQAVVTNIGRRGRRLRRIGVTLLLAIAALAPSTSRLVAQRAQLEKIVQRRVLPNGLEVIVIENHGVPLVTAEVTVRNGKGQKDRLTILIYCKKIHILQSNCSGSRRNDDNTRNF